jgi:hypothetical protein
MDRPNSVPRCSQPAPEAGSFEIVVLYAFVFLCAVAFMNAPGTEDVGAWREHMDTFSRAGLVQGYVQINDDIPPLGASLLWLMSLIAGLAGLPAIAVLKVALGLFTVTSVKIFYDWTRSPIFCLGLFSAVIFNVGLGYLDVLYLPFLLWSLRDLQAARYRRGAVLYCLAGLIKWQPFIAGPFFFLQLVLPGWRFGFRNVLPALLVGIVVAAGFGFVELANALLIAMEQNFISGQALNLMWLVTAFLQYTGIGGSSLQEGLVHWQLDLSGEIGLASKLLFLGFYGALIWRYVVSDRSFATTLLFATAAFSVYFAFGFSVHENHLFVACALGLALGYLIPEMRFLAALLIGMSAMNLLLFYGLSGAGLGFSRVYGLDISVLFAILMIAVCLRYWTIAMFKPIRTTPQTGGSMPLWVASH